VRIIYDKIRNSAIDKLNSIYNEQMEQSVSALNQARQIAQSEEMKQEDINIYLSEVGDKIIELQSLLEKYR